MNSSDQNSKLPLWPFYLADLLFIGGAVLIARGHDYRLSPGWLVALLSCIVLGAAALIFPHLWNHVRQRDEVLDERQRALEALARTVSSSAEQISIAATGLHEIAELSQKNLRAADHLPQKLQEKVAELQASLAEVRDTEKEELERELLALRTSESERLETVSQRIAKSSAEWTKLEAATQQHLAAATDALARLQRGTADAIGKAQAAAEQALAQARTEAARDVGAAAGTATQAIASARTSALSDLDTRLAATTAALDQLAARLAATAQALDEKLARVQAPAPAAEPVAASTPPAALESVAPEPETPPAADPADTPALVSAPPRRPRRARREEPAPEAAATSGEPTPSAPAAASEATPASSVPSEPPTDAPIESAIATPAESVPPAAAEEPTPVPAAAIAEIAPVAPHTQEPFPTTTADSTDTAETAPAPDSAAEPAVIVAAEGIAPTPAPIPPTEAEAPKPTRKRATRKSDADTADDEPHLGLDLDEPASRAAAAGVLERVLTSDGATRLLVTAYIGIGNRLFIRGEGPGLTWEKGVPLQFVSIGKWRWETNDAAAPVQFKLYKNDDLECASLGRQSLEPGHLQEVTASF